MKTFFVLNSASAGLHNKHSLFRRDERCVFWSKNQLRALHNVYFSDGTDFDRKKKIGSKEEETESSFH